MYKKMRLLITIVLCMLLCGCDMTWMDGEYHNVTPHLQQDEQQEDTQKVCRSYDEIQDSLVEMVENGTTKGMIYTEGFSQEQTEVHLAQAIEFATKSNAIGAYAVDHITFEVGTNAATTAAAVEISYIHDRSEIVRIKRTQTMKGAINLITAALDNCNEGITLLVERYITTDFTQVIEDYVDDNPHICMETPQVNIVTYPERGIQRVIQLTFTYQTSRDTLRMMQDNVAPVFSSAELYVRGDALDAEKYSQLYSFLMERYEYTVETSITPSYSLLRHGVGDSKAFARVYTQMCKQAGLECQVISGTKAGESWYWNEVKIENTVYYVDLLECKLTGVFQPKLQEEMSGYVWDYSQINTENG